MRIGRGGRERVARGGAFGVVAIAVIVGTATAPAAAQSAAQRQASARAMVRLLDQDGDERVARREWKRTRREFEAFDVDRDGFLVYGELLAALSAERQGEGAAPLPVFVALRDRERDVEAAAYDADRDGRLARREYEDYVFALADQQQDGKLVLDEAYWLVRHADLGAPYGGDEQRFLSRHDRSRDGAASRAEFALDDKTFAARDADGDGAVGPAELGRTAMPQGLQAFAAMNPDALLERYDRDGDGALGGGEVPGGARSLLNRADRDEDGRIDRDELLAALRGAQERQFEAMPPSFLERYDLNRDGKVARREFPGDDRTFARLDRDRDGAVSRTDG